MKTISQKIKNLILKNNISASDLSGSGHASAEIKLIFQFNKKMYFLEFRFERVVKNNVLGICYGIEDKFLVIIHESKNMNSGYILYEDKMLTETGLDIETFSYIRDLMMGKVIGVDECIKERQKDIFEALWIS